MKYLLYISLAFFLVACNNHRDTSKLSSNQKPIAISKMNEIVIISDDDVWNGATGDTLRYYFESAYPILPSPEPMFDLRHFTPVELKEKPLRTSLRTYLIVADLKDADSPTTQMVKKDIGDEKFNEALQNPKMTSLVGKNKWAQRQIVGYFFANGEKALQEVIKSKFPTFATRVRNHDEKALDASVFAVRKVNKGLKNKIENDFGVNISLPSDYKQALYKDNTAWFRKDAKKAILNIVIQKFPYTSKDQLSQEFIIKKVNDFGKKYVTSTTEGSHLVVNNEDLPVLDYNLAMGSIVKEFRGIWEMTADFYGGPFATYIYVEGSDLVLVTTFILAKGSKKRDFMMQLDYLVKKNYKK